MMHIEKDCATGLAADAVGESMSRIAAILVAAALAGCASLRVDDGRGDSVATAGAEPEVKTVSVNGASFRMIQVDGGVFNMGSPDGRDTFPVHEVTLDTFYIGETEVAQDLWDAVMDSNPSHFRGGRLPVETATLSDCHAFIKKLNAATGLSFRLPSEAEWEFAARGGNKSRGFTYAGSDNPEEVAWYDNADRTQPVGCKKPNELGLYDMSGNVCEWCEDVYGPYTAEPAKNPKGAEAGLYRLARGGGWNRGDHMCKVTDRGNYRPEYASNAVGLRLVLGIPPRR